MSKTWPKSVKYTTVLFILLLLLMDEPECVDSSKNIYKEILKKVWKKKLSKVVKKKFKKLRAIPVPIIFTMGVSEAHGVAEHYIHHHHHHYNGGMFGQFGGYEAYGAGHGLGWW